VALCPLSMGWVGGKIEASILSCKELSACYVVAVPRMLFSRWYTSPTPSAEGVENMSKSVAATTTLWLALAKMGSCRYARSIAAVRPTSSTDSH
jgi:hypothetical protein